MMPLSWSAAAASLACWMAFAASVAPAWLKSTISTLTESPRLVLMPAAALTRLVISV